MKRQDKGSMRVPRGAVKSKRVQDARDNEGPYSFFHVPFASGLLSPNHAPNELKRKLSKQAEKQRPGASHSC
jgi:hypothetical protein